VLRRVLVARFFAAELCAAPRNILLCRLVLSRPVVVLCFALLCVAALWCCFSGVLLPCGCSALSCLPVLRWALMHRVRLCVVSYCVFSFVLSWFFSVFLYIMLRHILYLHSDLLVVFASFAASCPCNVLCYVMWLVLFPRSACFVLCCRAVLLCWLLYWVCCHLCIGGIVEPLDT